MEEKITAYLDVLTHSEAFSRFRDLLLEYNKKFNLTSILDEKEICYKHFLDSVMGESFFPCGAHVLEVGSGAGFPSVPLRLVREDLCFTLVESTGKKCTFLEVVADRLNLQNVKVVNARAEDLARDGAYREKYDAVCARAVARLNTLCEYCLPFVKRGGCMIAYKGEAEEECREAERAISLLGGSIEKIFSYELPEEMGKRTLVVIRKVKDTPQKYPRGNGKERKDPLV